MACSEMTGIWRSEAFTGDCNALAVWKNLVLAGIGSQVHVYQASGPPAAAGLCCMTVLPDAARVHGICFLEDADDGDADSSRTSPVLIAVHGDRHVALLRLAESSGGSACRLTQLAMLPRLFHWSMDLHLSRAPGCSMLLSVGLSNNSVETYALPVSASQHSSNGGKAVASPVLLQCVESSERCLLYSMHLQRRDACSSGASCCYWVAAGTIFLDVVVWATPPLLLDGNTAALNNTCNGSSSHPSMYAVKAPALFRLKGHMGSIHRQAEAAAADFRTCCCCFKCQLVTLPISTQGALVALRLPSRLGLG